jgi:hypothetical protein
MIDMPRGGNMVAYEIVGDTSMRVQREINRITRYIDDHGGMATFRNPTPHGDVFISHGYVIETEKETEQCQPQ